MEPAMKRGVPHYSDGAAINAAIPTIGHLLPVLDMNRPAERIAIIGAGATGTYCLHSLITEGIAEEVTVFESSGLTGPGLAYSPELNDMHALSNIAGFEIPPLLETVNAWASRQPRQRLEQWGIADRAGDDRAFFPRAVLGAWLADQFLQLSADGSTTVIVHRCAEVVDMIAMPNSCRVEWRGSDGVIVVDEFDRVIVASGYGAIGTEDNRAERSTGKSASLAASDGTSERFGVLGSSLSGIDAVVAIAMARGSFERGAGALRYIPANPWSAMLMSRNGILPEADFWFPHPLPDLEGFTPESASACLTGAEGDLDRLFAQFVAVLIREAPDWSAEIGLGHATADDFAERYFARRRSSDAWAYARNNLAAVRDWSESHDTPSWRIVILKAHEIFASVIGSLPPQDLARLHRGLKRVFTDNYAAVPHLSIERVLALHDAGVLDVIALGNEYEIRPIRNAWLVRSPARSERFDELIDARGPQAAALTRFPFPTLRLQLCASALEESQDWGNGLNPAADLTVSDQDPSLRHIHLCALPFLLRNRPFVQGLVECAAMARCVSQAIRDSSLSEGADYSSPEHLIELIDRPSVILATGEVLPLAG
ncbi:FAD/NAD(P)-binding protein [Novosphingobium taihuense]